MIFSHPLRFNDQGGIDLDLKNTINTLEKLKTTRQLEPYINHIRFPDKYRNLEKGLRINFDFPITALVGPNGTNKSSILRAIYACPEGYSLEKFWFSTAVDPIDEDGGRSAYIYGYYQPDCDSIVEILKTRIKRVFKNKSDEVNPEYWEPSRPLARYDMDKMPEYIEGAQGRSKTRWNVMEKNVVFLDYRSEISAYDKYFYHGDLTRTLKYQSKQAFLREKSQLIRHVIDHNLQTKKMYRGKKEHLFKNIILNEEYVSKISYILGKNIQQVRVIEHKFFKTRGHTVMFRTDKHDYSEAAAGSGEYAIAMYVYKIFEAPGKSLIIFDEPEVSLHPGAQERLIEFLYEQVKINKHQIVLGTHSPHILKYLPQKAIKSLYSDFQENEVKVTSETTHGDAFYNVGYIEDFLRKTIFVEDRLAAEIVKRALKLIGKATFNSVDVKYMPGGSTVLLDQYLLPISLINKKECLFVLDGDEERAGIESIPDKLGHLDETTLDAIQVSLFGRKLEYKTDAGKGADAEKKKQDQRREGKIQTLEYCKTNLFYLPDKVVPEQFVWDNMDSSFRNKVSEEKSMRCYKERFEFLARKEYGKVEWEVVSGDEIFEVQKQCLATVPQCALKSLMKFINGQ